MWDRMDIGLEGGAWGNRWALLEGINQKTFVGSQIEIFEQPQFKLMNQFLV